MTTTTAEGRPRRRTLPPGSATLLLALLMAAMPLAKAAAQTPGPQVPDTVAPRDKPGFFRKTWTLFQPDGTPKPWPVPGRAFRLSLVCPGLGQIYTKHYWKLPLVYGVVGAPIYFWVSSHVEYKAYQQAYFFRVDGDPATVDAFPTLPDESLRTLRDFHRRNRDLSIILTLVGHLLQSVEAYVAAHLKHFDVSEDLSVRPGGWATPQGTLAWGVQVHWRLGG